AGRFDDAFKLYDAAVRVRTGNVDLRCDYARDLLLAGRTAEAERQLDEAKLLDAENPIAEALRAGVTYTSGDTAPARQQVRRARVWGSWRALARLVQRAIARRAGDQAGAEKAWAPVRQRIAKGTPPGYVFRPKLATWQQVHTLPAVERRLLEKLSGG